MCAVDRGEVLCEQGLADSVPTMVGVGGNEAEVIVRFVVRMGCLELGQHAPPGASAGADELFEQRRDLRLGLGCELGTVRPDPDRDGFGLLGHPHATSRHGAGDEQRPPPPELFGSALVVGKHPAPHRVMVKRDRDRVDHGVEVRGVRPPRVQCHAPDVRSRFG